ncbi:DUF4200 domain-containing protein [Kaistia soli]|uniref:DUF4200 domain-containing protein n=1 Tax=Kaistia soli TaxID=446684 RepID=UPI001AECA595|nr:DUF4200 domain-containing protein [Kaistia soli]
MTPASSGPGVAAVPPLPNQDSVEAQLASWTRKLDRFLEQSDRTVAIGRELVEQRALNLDLQRQIHRLEDELQSLRSGGLHAASDASSSGPAEFGQGGRSSLSRLIRRIFKP